MMKKQILATALCVIMMISLAACSNSGSSPADASSASGSSNGTAASADDHSDWITANWSFATWLTETNPFQENMVSLQKNLDNYCEGTIRITTYPSATLVAANDMLDGLDAGTCDLGYIQLDKFPNAFPVSQVMNYPGINYNSALVATKVWREFQKTFPMNEFDDYVIWLWQSSGPCCLFTDTPISSLSNISGKQLAAVGSVQAKILEAWGATPVTLDTSDIYEGIRSGLVNGRIGMFGACAMSNLDEVAKNAMVFPMGSYSFVGVMKKDLFDSMPASQQEAFMKAVDATFNDTTIYYQDAGLGGNPRVVECVGNLDSLNFASGEFLDELTDACSYMLEDYCAQLTKMGYDGQGAYNLLEELANKYNQEMTWEQYKQCHYENIFAGTYPQA